MLIWQTLLLFAILAPATPASPVANFGNTTLSSTNSAANLTAGAFETILHEGLTRMRETLPEFDIAGVFARSRRAPTRSSEDFQFIKIQVYNRKSKTFFQIQNTLAAPSLWLRPEKVPGPISARYTTWSHASVLISLETAISILRHFGFSGPWISVQIHALRVNPFHEPDGEIYFVFPMFARSRFIWYYVGSYTRNVHVVEGRGSTVEPDEETLASNNGTLQIS